MLLCQRHHAAAELLATASLRLADGDRTGAKRALSAGMGVVAAHRATLGATELRAHASAQPSR